MNIPKAFRSTSMLLATAVIGVVANASVSQATITLLQDDFTGIPDTNLAGNPVAYDSDTPDAWQLNTPYGGSSGATYTASGTAQLSASNTSVLGLWVSQTQATMDNVLGFHSTLAVTSGALFAGFSKWNPHEPMWNGGYDYGQIYITLNAAGTWSLNAFAGWAGQGLGTGTIAGFDSSAFHDVDIYYQRDTRTASLRIDNVELVTAAQVTGDVGPNILSVQFMAYQSTTLIDTFSVDAQQVIPGGTPNADMFWVCPGGSGYWATTANWNKGALPDPAGQRAVFNQPLTETGTITVQQAELATGVHFDSTQAYNLVGLGNDASLTIQKNSGSATISAANGSHQINLPLNLKSNTTFDVTNAADTITLSGMINVDAGLTLTKTGAGKVDIAGPQNYGTGATLAVQAGTVNFAVNAGQNLTIHQSGGTVNLLASNTLENLSITGGSAIVAAQAQAVLTVAGLAVSGSGELNLNDNGMIVKNGDVAAITAALKDKFIRSGSVDSSEGVNALGVLTGEEFLALGNTTLRGVAVGENDVVVKYTYAGDANLDGIIDGDDYRMLDTGLLLGLAPSWLTGDFDHSGSITGADYAAIDTAYGHQTGTPISSLPGYASHVAKFGASYLGALPATAVPEPTSLGLLGVGVLVTLQRRIVTRV